MATMVKFVKTASAALAIDPANFNGAVISAAGRMELDFTKTNGAATGTSLVDLNITDGAAGVEQKRVFQAIANAMGGHPRHGAVVEIADDLSGKYIHPDITSVQAVTV